MDGDLCAGFHHLNDGIQIREINLGACALRVEIQSQGDEVDVARSLAVSIQDLALHHRPRVNREDGPEQTAFYAVSSRHLAQFCCSNTYIVLVVAL